jgi:hypothetical protein
MIKVHIIGVKPHEMREVAYRCKWASVCVVAQAYASGHSGVAASIWGSHFTLPQTSYKFLNLLRAHVVPYAEHA